MSIKSHYDNNIVNKTLSACLWYPGIADDSIDAVEISLIAVRAARDTKIYFDMDRNGYVVSAVDDRDDEAEEVTWIEKSFIPASEKD